MKIGPNLLSSVPEGVCVSLGSYPVMDGFLMHVPRLIILFVNFKRKINY